MGERWMGERDRREGWMGVDGWEWMDGSGWMGEMDGRVERWVS